MPLDASVGTLLSNSYVTVEESDDYFTDDRAHTSSWGSNTQKDALLITSSRILDWQLKFAGHKTSPLQSMQFPRTGIVLSDGTEVPGDVIPQAVKFAALELALMFSKGDRTVDSALAGIEQVKAGPLFVKAVKGGYGDTSPKVVPDFIRAMLSEYVITGSMGFVVLERM
jgi:hypothetical protein